ncbi:MAG: TonB-dependent receptor [Flavobacteriaceae bacterium]
MKSTLFWIGILLSTQLLSGQQFILSGYVRDAQTGEELLFSSVMLQDGSEGIITNEYGYYALTLAAGEHLLTFSYVGYQSKTQSITLVANQSLNIALEPVNTQLDEIVVTADKEQNRLTDTEMSVLSLSPKEMKAIPVLFGEQDVLKTIQLLPGVSASSEGNSGFFVRGGDGDQNLILLDEAPVYNPAHFLGFFSVFNSDAIQNVKMYKGGIPAQYGGRASSVLDVRMKNGHMKEWSVHGGLGLISSKITVEGPLVADEGSVIISARRTYADILARPFLKDFDDFGLYFYDVNAKANYKLNGNNRLFASLYFGKDVLATDGFGLDWGNQTFTLRWNHVFSPSLFSNAAIIYSKYDYGFGVDSGGLDIQLKGGIYDFTLKQEYRWYQSPNHEFRFGWQSIFHQFLPSVFRFDATERSSSQEQNALEGGLYAAHEMALFDALKVNYGLRLSSFHNRGPYTFKTFDTSDAVLDVIQYANGDWYHTYLTLEPRVGMTYILSSLHSLKLNYNRNAQYLHLLSNSTSGSPTDIWIPSGPGIRPTIADQLAIGYFTKTNTNRYQLSLEAYYKSLDNTVEYEDGAEIFGNSEIESEIVFGTGRAYGVEFLMEKTGGDLTGWLSYTWSRSQRLFDAINEGAWFSARQDRPHDIALVAMYQLSDRLSVSANWVYTTGDAVTFSTGKYYIENALVNVYSKRNADRMPDYHRLDFGARWQFKSKRFDQSELNISIYNAYNRKNAYSIRFDTDAQGQSQATRLSLFGIVPSVSWNFKF